jgi:hypothetical protein
MLQAFLTEHGIEKGWLQQGVDLVDRVGWVDGVGWVFGGGRGGGGGGGDGFRGIDGEAWGLSEVEELRLDYEDFLSRNDSVGSVVLARSASQSLPSQLNRTGVRQ